jgi:uncharacterized protein (TIGR02391 family)
VRELLAKLQTAADVLGCTESQLDAIVLGAIAARIAQSRKDPTAARNVSLPEIQGMYPVSIAVTFAQRQEADAALTESWHRLLAEGFLMAAVGQSHGVMTLTRKGLEAAEHGNYAEIRVRQMLRREMLHPDLRGSVCDNFAAGHYDTAVLDAFKLVVVAVRSAGSLPDNVIGVKLMRQAYDPQKGPLRDPALPAGERDRMPDLFAGAIGVFKNPLSHRKVGKSDPVPVIEELMLASRLLRFVKP